MTARPPPLRFTEAEAEAAFDEWRFNCGPGSLCAVLGMTPAEIRPHLLGFEQKGYTNPTLMWGILNGLGVKWRKRRDPSWPWFGLVRVQWGGPWTREGVPMAARYRHTHWIAHCRGRASNGVFDINCMNSGGWIHYTDWSEIIVPELLRRGEPKASGEWWATHCVEVNL